MLTVETRHAIDPATARGFDTDALRRHFHVGGIFVPGEIRLIYSHYDRMIVGGAVPAGASLTLDRVAEAGTLLSSTVANSSSSTSAATAPSRLPAIRTRWSRATCSTSAWAPAR